MCRGCGECDDFPAAWSPKIARAVVLWRRLYDDLGQSTGGPLHVFVDDYNLDFDVIVPYYSERGADDETDSPAVREVCGELAALLTAMTVSERFTVMAYADGYHEVPGILPLASVDVREEVFYTHVKVTHLPTGISLESSGSTHEEVNRATAWRMLGNRLEAEAMTAELPG